MAELPVVCTLGPAALAARRQNLLAELLRHTTAHEELPEGHRLVFAAGTDTLSLIARTVEAERQCCRFLRFQITVQPDDGVISLDLTGPPGTREFLSALFEA